MTSAPGRLGRYEVGKLLVAGRTADLVLARATGLAGFERHVVIKRLHDRYASDPAFIDMFLTEARLAGVLHHHNIVQVHDVGDADGKPYFAMEYVHGEDLRKLLARLKDRGEQAPLEHVIGIVASAAAALHHAHEQVGADGRSLGIIHRDVTPANILIGYDGNVKVVDFGIAKAAMRTAETRTAMLKGKGAYMAPEQCTGKQVDRRSDVFSLGVVLYELATVHRLFKRESDFLTMQAVVGGDVPPPSQYRADLSPELEAIILKALSSEPAARYQTAEEMYVALDAAASKRGLHSSTVSLAAYVKRVFGLRPEPWLVEEPSAAEPDRTEPPAPPAVSAPPIVAAPSVAAPVAAIEATAIVTPLPSPMTTDPPRIDDRPSTPRRYRRLLIGSTIGVIAVISIIVRFGFSDSSPAPSARASASPPIMPNASPPTEQLDVAVEPPPVTAPRSEEQTPNNPHPSKQRAEVQKKPTPSKPAAPDRTKPGWNPNSLFPKKD